MASLFKLTYHSISRIFQCVLDVLYEKAKNLIYWPSRDEINARMPKSFKESYPNTRVIIDATEVKCESPKGVRQNVMLYSSYKNHCTLKWLVGVAPSGEIIYVSEPYGGRATDSLITAESGLVEKLEPNDIVLADKGFPGIVQDVNCKGSFVIMPPFKTKYSIHQTTK